MKTDPISPSGIPISKVASDPDSNPGDETRAVKYPALRQKMTDAQFTRMVTYACGRLKQLNTALGDWRDEMNRCRRETEGDLSDRRDGQEALIFRKLNDSADILPAAKEFVSSRIKEDVFGTEPWFMVVPEQSEAPVGQEAPDVTLAREIDEHAKWKLRCIGWKSAGRDAIDTAIDMGTAILKTTWKRKVETYFHYATVLVQATNPNEAITTGAGDYIYDTDALVEQRGVQGESGTLWHPADALHDSMLQDPGADPVDAEARFDALPRRTVPAKDVSTVVDLGDGTKPGAHQWEPYLIKENVIRYDDPLTEMVDDRNFTAPLGFARLEDVDFCAHTYDRRHSDIRGMLPQNDPRTDEILAAVKNDTGSRKEPAREDDKTRDGADDDNPRVQVSECYFDYDPLEDGNTCRVYLIVLADKQLGIDMGCDYLPNVTPSGEYPFSAVPICKKKNQWIGRGFRTIYRKLCDTIDRNLCAMMYRNELHANPVTGTHEDALDEEIDEIKIGPGETFALKKDAHMKDFLEAFVLPDLDQSTFEIIKFLINLFQLRSGVSSAAQGSVSSLPEINTATGINSVLASGSTLHNDLLEQIRGEVGQSGLIDHLDKTIRLLYTRQNREETFAYGEGKFQKIATLTPEQVRGLKMNVHFLLTRFKQKQDAENAQAALDVLLEYLKIPESEKPAARTLCVQLIKARGFDNADSIIREPLPPPPVAPALPAPVLPASAQPEAAPIQIPAPAPAAAAQESAPQEPIAA